MKNDGFDNEDSDYILYVNDILGSEEAGHKYVGVLIAIEVEAKANCEGQEPLLDFGCSWPRYFRPGCQVPKPQDPRGRGCQGDQEPDRLLQPKYDGGVCA